MASFFEQQDKAQSRTWVLGVLFTFGAVGTFLAAWAVTAAIFRERALTDPRILLGTLAAVGAMTVVPALYKYVSLGGHGSKVAEALGGRRIDPATANPDERRVMNVVEEMAIASGMPVPPVYLIHDGSINAFAAGTSPADAALGITTGAIRRLDRDELEGVMAHEFSHIFHGDMRINLRALAAIFGMMAIGYVGYHILRAAPRGGKKGGGGIALFGLALAIVGGIGTLFGRLMQAAISRQREYLADATAVQYTRNPGGIGGALRKISELRDPTLSMPEASQFNHFFFTAGIQTWMASHPPVEERIRRIEAMAGGVLPERPRRAPAREPVLAVAQDARMQAAAGSAARGIVQAFSEIGSVDRRRLDAVRQAVERTPEWIVSAVHSHAGARAVMGLSLLHDSEPHASAGLQVIAARDPEAHALCASIAPALRAVPRRDRVALLELACGTLTALDLESYRSFRSLVTELIRMDRSVDLFEWMAAQMLRARVEDRFRGQVERPRAGTATLASRATPAMMVLGLVACTTGRDDAAANEALQAGLASIGFAKADLPAPAQRSLDALSAALDALDALKPSECGRLLSACVTVALHDGVVRDDEVFVLRSIAERLHVPMPPVQPA